MRTYLLPLLLVIIFSHCSPSRQIARSANRQVIHDPALRLAHVGISIYDAGKGKYLYDYQGDKYFVPASNTKLATCYAALKYLGDSLVGMRYARTTQGLWIAPNGDPTFLHPDFAQQRVYDFLKKVDGPLIVSKAGWKEQRWGSGWSWNDYADNYMAERSLLPVYGNIARFSQALPDLRVMPRFFRKLTLVDTSLNGKTYPATVTREMENNRFRVEATTSTPRVIETPFYTGNFQVLLDLLSDTLGKQVEEAGNREPPSVLSVLHSQPTDSLLAPMMHHSDNFFAEQSLLMVSNGLLGEMNDARIIDTLLETDLKDLPQKPHWVDGSGLSRYNLFTPQDFVSILNKMRLEFGMSRLKGILATGNEGTLTHYYQAEKGYIFAKTGTLSGVVSCSGFLYTKSNRLLIFSVLVNNHQTSATAVRKAVERFIEGLR